MKEKYTISVSKGDGIGPEVVGSALEVLNSATERSGLGDLLEFIDVPVGWELFNAVGFPITEEVLDTIGMTDCLILGPLEVGSYPGDNGRMSPSGAIRKRFDLYANVRPVKTYIKTNQKPIDILIVRENTQGFYADRNMFMGSGEYMPAKDVALSVRVITREKSEKISRIAFESASQRRKKVTAVHKGNVLRVTDGLFLEEYRKVANEYPQVRAEDRIVDSTAYDLILNPEQFDVIVTTNMYGDILSDEAAAIAGSLGVAPAINYGDNFGISQAAHGTASAIAGKGIANPISEIMSVSLLLKWLSGKHEDERLKQLSSMITASVNKALQNPHELTEDLGGTGNLQSVTEIVSSSL